MSLLQTRGGIPYVRQDTIDSTGRRFGFPQNTMHLMVRNLDDTNAVKLYFTEEDYDNDENYLTVPPLAAETPHGMIEGPFDVKEIWLVSASGAAVEICAFLRLG